MNAFHCQLFVNINRLCCFCMHSSGHSQGNKSYQNLNFIVTICRLNIFCTYLVIKKRLCVWFNMLYYLSRAIDNSLKSTFLQSNPSLCSQHVGQTEQDSAGEVCLLLRSVFVPLCVFDKGKRQTCESQTQIHLSSALMRHSKKREMYMTYLVQCQLALHMGWVIMLHRSSGTRSFLRKHV